MKSMTTDQVTQMILSACDAIIQAKDYLTEVDSAIGDGDHGVGMSGGMEKAKEMLQAGAPFRDVNTVFKTTGMAMLNTMGGASGVIFGSMFLGGIKKMESIQELEGAAFARIMRGALDTIKQRGNAQVGDKTMVDALEPAVLAMEASGQDDLTEVLRIASEQAAIGVENTKQYVAKYGRAQYLGERAIGFQDAGATSVSILFRAMYEFSTQG